MNLPGIRAPSGFAPPSENRTESSPGGFRTHLARALAGAAGAAAAVAPAAPAAGVVAAGLGGISRILDSEAAHSARSGDDLETVLSESRGFNARYIELQARMQMESQAFTAVSNIMKARHESAQTALNNIR